MAEPDGDRGDDVDRRDARGDRQADLGSRCGVEHPGRRHGVGPGHRQHGGVGELDHGHDRGHAKQHRRAGHQRCGQQDRRGHDQRDGCDDLEGCGEPDVQRRDGVQQPGGFGVRRADGRRNARSGGGGLPVFTNAGTFRKSAGTATPVDVALNNSGTVDLQVGDVAGRTRARRWRPVRRSRVLAVCGSRPGR